MICLIALIVFAVLGIFSAKYRSLAYEAFDCVFRRLTLRPCESKLDERIKSHIVVSSLKVHPAFAKFVNRYFEVFSWILVVLTVVSLFFTAQGIYNYAVYGNCNGPESTGFCVFDVFTGGSAPKLTNPGPSGGVLRGSADAPRVLIEFACFTCPYSKQAQPALNDFLAKHPEVALEFHFFPIEKHAFSFEASEAALCADEQGAFWPYHDLLFAHQNALAEENLFGYAAQLNLDSVRFQECFKTGRYAERVLADAKAGKKAGVYGTPTFFIGNSALVGVKTVGDFEKALNGVFVDGPNNQTCH